MPWFTDRTDENLDSFNIKILCLPHAGWMKIVWVCKTAISCWQITQNEKNPIESRKSCYHCGACIQRCPQPYLQDFRTARICCRITAWTSVQDSMRFKTPWRDRWDTVWLFTHDTTSHVWTSILLTEPTAVVFLRDCRNRPIIHTWTQLIEHSRSLVFIQRASLWGQIVLGLLPRYLSGPPSS